jgi:hypothetical protein
MWRNAIGVNYFDRYRKWRTERKVLCMVILTWIIPSAVFFPSIFGWQYFVGYRSVPAGKCYVQYMEDALFNCLLQVYVSLSVHKEPEITIFNRNVCEL